MSGKPKLYLLDACVLIELHRFGLWRAVVERAQIVLGSTIANKESRFYRHKDGSTWGIDLEPDVSSGSVTVLDVSDQSVEALRERFDAAVVQSVDPGELEALGLLVSWDPDEPRPLFCTGDQLAAVAACLLGQADALVSLEGTLQCLGIPRPADLPRHFTEAKLQAWIARGRQAWVTGTGLR